MLCAEAESQPRVPKLTGWGATRYRLVVAGLIGAAWLFPIAVLAQSPVTVAIDTQSPGYAIPDDFSGLSFEIGTQRPGHGGVGGYIFSATNTPVVTLFQNIGLRNLRIGGGTVDGIHAVLLNHTAIDNLFGFARAVGNLGVIYSLQLLNGNTITDAVTAQYIWQNYRPWLDGFALGNEPDWPSYDYPPFGTGTDPAITNYTSYLADWRTFAAAVTNAAPGATFAGPDTGDYTGSTYYQGQSWTQHFADDEKNSGEVVLITQHYYVGGSPGSTTAQQAINKMLSTNWVTLNYPWLYNNNLAPVVADGLPYRLTESNDYLTGVTNASNAFASALWALDYLHWWAAHGCAGVNFHNKPWLVTDTIYFDSSSGNYRVNPKAYGIRAFDVGGHGFVEPVMVTNVNGLDLTAYAVGNSTNLDVTIINKEHGNGARDAAVTVMANGLSSGSVSVMVLTDGKAGDASLTTNITLGGAVITNNVPWRGQWTPLGKLANGQCTVTVKAASAAIVRIQPATMVAPPVIGRDLPAEVPLVQGKNYRYSVTVKGASPMRYQWYQGANPIVGAVGSSYLLTAGAVGSTATYHVVITNGYGAVTSRVSTVTVIPPLLDYYATHVASYGPVGYWPLQETDAPAPALMETNYGTLGALGDAYYATTNGTDVTFLQTGALAGASDASVAFNGNGNSGTIDSYAFIPRGSPALTLRPPFTLEAWVNSSSTSFADIMGEGGSGLDSVANAGNFGGIRMSWGGNNGSGPDLQAYVYTGAGGNYVALKGPGGSAPYGTWHYCAITYDGSTVNLYGDGQPQGSKSVIMNTDTWTPLTIGAGRWQGAMPTRALSGRVDEVAVYTNALTPAQITAHYLAGTTPGSNYMQTVLDDHPLLYYRMDNPGYAKSNPSFYPVAVNYGSAPVNGGYPPGTVPGGVAGPPIPALGTNSLASPINGINSCVDAGNDPAFNPTGTQPFTAMIWFKANPADGRLQAIMSHGANSSWAINLIGTNGTVLFSTGAAGSVPSTNLLNDGDWHQVAGVYDGSHNYLYVDGALNNSRAATGGIVGNTNDDAFLGGDPDFTIVGINQRYFAGAIAQAAFFTNALTSAQIQAIYQAGSITPPPDVLTSRHLGVNQLQLNWHYGRLQSASNVSGPYTSVGEAFPPWPVSPTNSQQFYRLKEN